MMILISEVGGMAVGLRGSGSRVSERVFTAGSFFLPLPRIKLRLSFEEEVCILYVVKDEGEIV